MLACRFNLILLQASGYDTLQSLSLSPSVLLLVKFAISKYTYDVLEHLKWKIPT